MIKKNLGRHILVEYYDCNEKKISNSNFVKNIMNKSAILANANIVESVFHQFNPWGVSGVVVIEESHLTVHTWPEYNYAAVDLFTCGDSLDPIKAFEYIQEEFESKRWELKELTRGNIEKINNK